MPILYRRLVPLVQISSHQLRLLLGFMQLFYLHKVMSSHVFLLFILYLPLNNSGLVNTFGVHLLRQMNNVSIWWHAVGTTSLIIAILAKAPTHQSGKFVFQTFIDNTGGWAERASPAYVVIVSSGCNVLDPNHLRIVCDDRSEYYSRNIPLLVSCVSVQLSHEESILILYLCRIRC